MYSILTDVFIISQCSYIHILNIYSFTYILEKVCSIYRSRGFCFMKGYKQARTFQRTLFNMRYSHIYFSKRAFSKGFYGCVAHNVYAHFLDK